VASTPKLTLAIALVLLAALATTISYTGYLIIGLLADYLGTTRFLTGLVLGILFARFPSTKGGKLHPVGLLPKAARRPLILAVLSLSLASFVMRGDTVPASFAGFTIAFLLGFAWLRKAIFARVTSSVRNFAGGQNTPVSNDDNVIEGEFRETKG
jgi:hypothetical protein